MDEVFDAQFRAMQAAHAREGGVGIDVAYAPDGRADYLYATDRLLTNGDPEVIARIQRVLPWATHASPDEQPTMDGLTILTIEHQGDGYLAVPDALDRLDAEFGDDNPGPRGATPLVTPVHMLHVAAANPAVVIGRLCPATEPVPPSGGTHPDGDYPPVPPLVPGRGGGLGTLIGICDTGLLADLAHAPWLAGVTGQTDPLGPPSGGHQGLPAIPHYTGHGTFGAGVARCQAPGADIYVANAVPGASGAVCEHVIAAKLKELTERHPAPQIINLSAGGYTRHDWKPLSFSVFSHDGIILTAAAGNDGTDRPFYPAAFDWAVGIGALTADRKGRAPFSNHGDWVKVYTVGEDLVNAYATGVYTYREPPKKGTEQVFEGLAQWSGTSFAAPLVAGLIAAKMASDHLSAAEATKALLAQAAEQAIEGVGPVLYPGQP